MNYRRADERITEDVCDRLTDARDIDATDIEVAVADGEVTLSGRVDDREQKRRAEDVVERVSGVRDVHNSLRVGRNGDARVAGSRDGGAISITGTNSGSLRSSASGGGVDIPNPGITGGGLSGATDVSTAGGGGGAAGVPANPLGLRDTPDSANPKR